MLLDITEETILIHIYWESRRVEVTDIVRSGQVHHVNAIYEMFKFYFNGFRGAIFSLLTSNYFVTAFREVIFFILYI